MEDPIQSVIRRTRRYWYVDGLSEIAAGFIILILAAFYWMMGLVHPGSLTASAVGIGQPLVVLAGAWLAYRIVPRLKERLTYPRTGYVAYSKCKGRRRILVTLATGVLAGILAGVLSAMGRGVDAGWLPFFVAVALALAFVVIGAQYSLSRFYAVAVYTLVLGAWVAWLRLPDAFSNALFFGGIAVSWLVSGGLTLVFYLRSTHPLLTEDDDDRAE